MRWCSRPGAGFLRRLMRREQTFTQQAEMPLVRRATLPVQNEKRGASPQRSADSSSRRAPHLIVNATPRDQAVSPDQKALAVQRALRNLHLLVRSERLYEKNHPSRLDSLDGAYDSLRDAAETLGGLEIRVERGGLVAPRISDAHLPDARGEMQALAIDLQRAGIHNLAFSKKFHVGELDTLARLMKASLLRSEEPAEDKGNSWWSARLLEHRVEGISVNTQTERRGGSARAGLITAPGCYGRRPPRAAPPGPPLNARLRH